MAHAHNIINADDYFVIDARTRNVLCGTTNCKNIMQFDHNSEQIVFKLPRYIEGHDMLTCNSVKVHYSNTSANQKLISKDIFEIDDLAVYADDSNYLTCSWTISGNATKFAGNLSFTITFACVSDEDVDYAWSAGSNSGITVLQCQQHSNAIAEAYSDALIMMSAQINSHKMQINQIWAEINALKAT